MKFESDISLKSLNQQQKDAVIAPLKPVLVVAGAGTGKTTVLVKRFEYLVKEKKIPPESITIVIFTNKAAREIKKRIYLLFNKDEEFLNKLNVSTFHKFCINVLENKGNYFKFCNDFEAVEYVKQSISRLGLQIKSNWEVTKLIWKVRWYQHIEKRKVIKEDLLRAGRHCTNLSDEEINKKYPFEDFKALLNEYENTLLKNRSFYFDDIQFEVDKLLDNQINKEWLEQKVQAILFDEFQDIDPVQLSIITKLSKNKGNIFCVGDPDQSIYAFRNAIPKSFERFKQLIVDVEIKKLEINYRSTFQILDVANKLINKGKTTFSKNLFSASKDNLGEPVKLFVTNDPDREIKEIIDTIVNMRSSKKIPFRNFAVLFRNWSFSRKLSDALIKNGIPYFSEDLKNIWNKEEIRDSLAYLNLAFEKTDIVSANKSLLRIINKPARGIGPKTLLNLKKEAKILGITLLALIKKKSNKDPKCANLLGIITNIRKLTKGDDLLEIKMRKILRVTGLIDLYEKQETQRLLNINTFLGFISELNLKDYAEALEKLKQLTKFTNDRDAVYLSTVHSAKGLEFNHVFIMHLEEGKLPSKFSYHKTEELEEERRIVYVAITRAKKSLFLSCSGGEEKISRFIKDIEDLVEKTVDISKNYIKISEEQELWFNDVISNNEVENQDIFFDDFQNEEDED